jgi:predicted nucleotide-binding protein
MHPPVDNAGVSSDPIDPDREAAAALEAEMNRLIPDRKVVMVIYGHDREAKAALFDWLRAIGLQPREWNQLIRSSGSASPYIGDVLNQAFKDAQAVIAFFTPDERVIDRTVPENHGAWRLQARPNVLIEAGMALITHPQRTVLAVLGPQDLPSDLAGRHYVRLNHTSVEPLNDLATRLRDAGCDTDLTGSDWLNPARFPDRDNLTPQPVISRPPPTTSDGKTSARKRKQPDRQDNVLPPIDPSPYTHPEKYKKEYAETDLALHGRLLLTGQPGRRSQISKSARDATLAALASDDADLTGNFSALVGLMNQMSEGQFGVAPWQLSGPNGTQQISASWQGITSTGRRLTEARLHASLLPRTSGDGLTITIDVLLSDPLHPTLSDTFSRAKNPKAFEASPKAPLEEIFGPRYVPKPFLGLGALGHNGLALGDLPGVEQVELDFPDDAGDAGLAWFPGGEVAGFP